MHRIEVYYKENCSYCSLAKGLLEEKKLPAKYIKLEKTEDVEALKQRFPSARTVPVVVIDGEFIGGYHQLSSLLESDQFVNPIPEDQIYFIEDSEVSYLGMTINKWLHVNTVTACHLLISAAKRGIVQMEYTNQKGEHSSRKVTLLERYTKINAEGVAAHVGFNKHGNLVFWDTELDKWRSFRVAGINSVGKYESDR